MASSAARSAVLAINPFHFSSLPHPSSFERIKTYLNGTFENLWPVFVCGPNRCQDWQEDSEAKQTLQALRALHLPDLQMLRCQTDFPADKGKILHEEASRRKADFIGLTTQSHLRIRDLWGKGFVEEMLGSCALPLLFLPRQEVQGQTHKAFFSSDFSDHSRKSYQRFLRQMENDLDELVLFHALSLPIETLSASAYSGVPASLSDQELVTQSEQIKEACQNWLQESRRLYPRIHFRSRLETVTQSLAKTILGAAKEENAGLIGLASQSSPVAGLFLGSPSRDVLEEASCPVWTCGLHLGD
jgi:nucleotide-binding universal stress UspA family protein